MPIKLLLSLTILTLSGATSTVFAQSLASEPRLNAPAATANFNDQSKSAIIWDDEANYQALIEALEELSVHGLTPEDYHLEALKSRPSPSKARDRLATDGWMSAAAHMLHGKLNPTSVEPDWTAARRDGDLPNALRTALLNNSVSKSLAQFAPTQPAYVALRDELASLTQRDAQQQTVIPAGETLKAGMNTARVRLLKARLDELGYLAGPSSDNFMDEDTIKAVRDFQLDFELNDDGVVGPMTLTALNRGLSGQIDQLRVNMERWRWLPNDLGKKHLRANIAGFDVAAWNNGVVERRHLIIVGRTYRKTPVFSDSVKYLEFNPWWETPMSIMRRDKLPTFRKDPASVERLGFEIRDTKGSVVNPSSIDWSTVDASNFPYRIRQRPGEENALGQVKIMFPNKHNVYLHDTPTKGLFSQRQRAFSSGCIRTENPIDLSEWLLSDSPGWDRVRIDTAIATGRETRATLAKPIPVHILYFTVVSEGDYGVRYLDDIYDRDGRVLAGLNLSSAAN